MRFNDHPSLIGKVTSTTLGEAFSIAHWRRNGFWHSSFLVPVTMRMESYFFPFRRQRGFFPCVSFEVRILDCFWQDTHRTPCQEQRVGTDIQTRNILSTQREARSPYLCLLLSDCLVLFAFEMMQHKSDLTLLLHGAKTKVTMFELLGRARLFAGTTLWSHVRIVIIIVIMQESPLARLGPPPPHDLITWWVLDCHVMIMWWGARPLRWISVHLFLWWRKMFHC